MIIQLFFSASTGSHRVKLPLLHVMFLNRIGYISNLVLTQMLFYLAGPLVDVDLFVKRYLA